MEKWKLFLDEVEIKKEKYLFQDRKLMVLTRLFLKKCFISMSGLTYSRVAKSQNTLRSSECTKKQTKYSHKQLQSYFLDKFRGEKT